jgi:nitroreductase
MKQLNQTIIDAFHFRHACKDFDDTKKISKEDFTTIVEAGRLSPSSFGFEPWKFLVIQNPVIRTKLADSIWGADDQLPHSSHFVIILARKGVSIRPDAEYLQSFMKDVRGLPDDIRKVYTEYYTQFVENDFKLTTDEALHDWAKRQTYIPLANMMTVAAQLGIDSCPIEGFDIEKMNQKLSEVCNVDTDEFGISVMVAFGYRVKDQRPKMRQSMDVVVEFI